MTILNEQPQQASSTIRTLEQKIEELANTIVGFRNICRDTKKTIMQQMVDVRQLASDLNIDNIQLRKMISRSFTIMGVSKSWLRKLLPASLKYRKHTRKDYLLKQQQQQEEHTFTALGRLEHLKNRIPVRVTVNLKTKTIEFMEIAQDLIQALY